MKGAPYPKNPILLVDDEEDFLLSVEMTLRANGFNNVETCSDSRRVVKLIDSKDYALIALDINMPHLGGLDLLAPIVDYHPDVPVIMVTAVTEVEKAVRAMKTGAFDYLVKPVDETRLVTTFSRALDLRDIKRENVRLKHYLLDGRLENPDAFEAIISRNKVMESIFKYCEAIAVTHLPVLVTGETGVGKELIAEAIHTLSGRPGNMVTVNVAGVDDTLFSDTLFGHRKGAFTGASTDRKGLIEEAGQGTLFLDEIGDLRAESQVKLLRLLQQGSYFPLGSDVARRSDARIVVATNRELASLQNSGDFRKDLFYRLKAHHVHVPPLRERKNDIPLLTDHFLRLAAEKLNKRSVTPPRELYTLLSTYSFPGNIRELEGLIFDAVSRHQSGVLSLQVFKEKVAEARSVSGPLADNPLAEDRPVRFGETLPTLKEAEKLLVEEALRRSDNNQSIAARLLGISRRALNNRLRRSEE